jgi:hypothetical protein
VYEATAWMRGFSSICVHVSFADIKTDFDRNLAADLSVLYCFSVTTSLYQAITFLKNDSSYKKNGI